MRIVRPVGAEFEFEDDAGSDADREVDSEDPHPKLDGAFPKLVAGTVVDGLHDGADEAQT